jgi:hypothetical protein
MSITWQDHSRENAETLLEWVLRVLQTYYSHK